MDTAAAAAVAAGALAYYEGQPRQKRGVRGAVTAEAFTPGPELNHRRSIKSWSRKIDTSGELLFLM